MKQALMWILCAFGMAVLAQAQYAGSAAGSSTLAGEIDGKINHQEGAGAPSALNCTQGRDLYTNTTNNDQYKCTGTGAPGTWALVDTTAGGAVWGGITGTLSGQTDLAAALALKSPLASPVFTGQATIPDMTLAGHSHLNAAGGGALDAAAIASGIFNIARIPTGINGTTVALGNHTHTGVYSLFTHASTHQNGGADEVGTATPGANAIPKAGAGGTLAVGWIPTLNQSTTGNAATSTALATLPTPCSAGSYPLGILANGNSTGCTVASGGGAIGIITFPTAAFTNAAGAWTSFAPDTIDSDSSGGTLWAVGTPTLFKAPSAGRYTMQCGFYSGAPNWGQVAGIRFLQTGGIVTAGTTHFMPVTTYTLPGFLMVSASHTFNLAANDTVECQYFFELAISMPGGKETSFVRWSKETW